MMFKQIESNVRWSVVLIIAMTALLAAMGYFVGQAMGAPEWAGPVIAGCLAILMGLIAYYSGGSLIMALSGARKVTKQDYPQLFNVVEEMAIAAGLPMPAVYVIDDPSPNAFATGRNPQEAAIAVTTGLMSKLNRYELQGVIAHEMSHIRNYDILFMMMMVVMVGSIALIADFFRRYLWWGGGRSRSSRDSGGNAIILIIALVLAILAPLAASLIQLAASRRREYLADASGALLSRYPEGLASALRKISSDPEPLEAANRATQSLYIVNPLMKLEDRSAALLSTHPPIEERIKRLERMAYMSHEDRQGRPAMPRAQASSAQPAPQTAASMDVASPLPMAAFAGGAGVSRRGGRPAAGSQSTLQPATPDACPRCGEGLGRTQVKGRKLRPCRECGGVWTDHAALGDLLGAAPRSLRNIDDKYPNLVGVGWNRIGPKICPDCGQALREMPVKGLETVQVDTCPKCKGVWFDDGELAVVAHAAEKAGK